MCWFGFTTNHQSDSFSRLAIEWLLSKSSMKCVWNGLDQTMMEYCIRKAFAVVVGTVDYVGEHHSLLHGRSGAAF